MYIPTIFYASYMNIPIIFTRSFCQGLFFAQQLFLFVAILNVYSGCYSIFSEKHNFVNILTYTFCTIFDIKLAAYCLYIYICVERYHGTPMEILYLNHYQLHSYMALIVFEFRIDLLAVNRTSATSF